MLPPRRIFSVSYSLSFVTSLFVHCEVETKNCFFFLIVLSFPSNFCSRILSKDFLSVERVAFDSVLLYLFIWHFSSVNFSFFFRFLFVFFFFLPSLFPRTSFSPVGPSESFLFSVLLFSLCVT